jgi:L-lactate utilization protein LutC
MTSEVIEGGYVYVLYNPIYDRYGEIYKIGQAKDVKDRLKSYSTSYPEKSEIKYSIKHSYYKDIERIVHLTLKEYRTSNNREYFKCSLDVIKETLDKVKEYTLEEISSILNKDIDLILKRYKDKKVKVKETIELGVTKLFSCKTCTKNFKSKFSLERHDTSCKGQPIITEFRCEYCLKYYTTKQNLQVHREICKVKKDKNILLETKLKLQELEIKMLKQKLKS